MAKIYFHVDVNSAFLSWSALKALQDGGTVDLRTIPAVVGGDETKRHGVVLAKSGPAKQYGIKTGESLFAARTKCPGLTVVPPDFDWYVQNSKALIQILNDYTPDVEQYSIDEAFLNMTGSEGLDEMFEKRSDHGRKGLYYSRINVYDFDWFPEYGSSAKEKFEALYEHLGNPSGLYWKTTSFGGKAFASFDELKAATYEDVGEAKDYWLVWDCDGYTLAAECYDQFDG